MSEKMTITEYLVLPPEEQALEAAKCFTPKPWKHDIVRGVNFLNPCSCERCGRKEQWYTELEETFCPVPDPLTLDWNNAKRLQGECEVADFLRSLNDIAKKYYHDNRRSIWKICWAKPIHYIAACMAAKGYFSKPIVGGSFKVTINKENKE